MELSNNYKVELEDIKAQIQASELLASFLEEEEDSYYDALVEEFEPKIAELYDRVAEKDPLQLESLENEIIDEGFEGLFIPKLLAYSVLRGAINPSTYKFILPQDHFKKILEAMINSYNFEQIAKRTGQSIALGFGMSSSIWVTHFLNSLTNKRVSNYFNKFTTLTGASTRDREQSYKSLYNQFSNAIFHTADFPKDKKELKTKYPQIKKFLLARISKKLDNSTLVDAMVDMLGNPDFHNEDEFLPLFALFANFNSSDQRKDDVKAILTKVRKEQSDFSDRYFAYLEKIYNAELPITPKADQHMYELVDPSIDDDLKKYYGLVHAIYTKGYIHEDVIARVKEFYYAYDGLSNINECLRQSLLTHFNKIFSQLPVEDYPEYFELNKIFIIYKSIFENAEFNLQYRDMSLAYVRRLLKKYTNKRGKDYQDIKKFVSTTYVDLGLMNEKQVKEFFMTKRKRPVAS